MTTQNCINATPPFSLANGGTNNGSLTASAGGIVWSDSTKLNVLAGTATAGQVLVSGSSTTPSWSTTTFPSTIAAGDLLYASSANVISGLATANNGTLTTNASGVPSITTMGANGDLLIGSASGPPTAATLTAGTNVSITNAANSITINATGAASFAWVNQNTSSVTMAINTGYITNNGASLVTYTIPTTAAQGTIFEIAGSSAGGWTLVYGSGVSIQFGSITTTTTTGSLSSSNAGDCVRFVCITANTKFAVLSSIGNITYV